MTNTLSGPDEEISWLAIQSELDGLPHIKEKMLVDLVNGLSVSKNMIEYKGNQKFISRFFGALDGSNRRREIMIQEQTQNSLETLTSWTLELTENVSASMNAITRVASFLQNTRSDLLNVAKEVLRHKVAISALENRLNMLENRIEQSLSMVHDRLLKLEIRKIIDETIEGWRSGRLLPGYPLAIQAMFVLDGLLHGEPGIRIVSEKNTTAYLCDRVVNTLKEKDNRTERLSPLTDFWLAESRQTLPLKRQLIAYGASWRNKNSLHNAISENAEQNVTPAWTESAQEQGFLPVLLDAEVWTEKLQAEAVTLLKNETTRGDESDGC